MIQNEFRQSDQKTKFLIDTGYVMITKILMEKIKTLTNFLKYKINLDLQIFYLVVLILK